VTLDLAKLQKMPKSLQETEDIGKMPRPASWAGPIQLDSGRGDVFAEHLGKAN
jgi:hypothetical protein